MKYHALLVIFEKAAKFKIMVCCKLYVALKGLIRAYISDSFAFDVAVPFKLRSN